MEEMCVLEYNLKQKFHHIMTIKERNCASIKSNLDWTVIYIGKKEKCFEIANKILIEKKEYQFYIKEEFLKNEICIK
jgi:hypothetical protein